MNESSGTYRTLKRRTNAPRGKGCSPGRAASCPPPRYTEVGLSQINPQSALVDLHPAEITGFQTMGR